MRHRYILIIEVFELSVSVIASTFAEKTSRDVVNKLSHSRRASRVV